MHIENRYEGIPSIYTQRHRPHLTQLYLIELGSKQLQIQHLQAAIVHGLPRD